jgi:hypothetical protein
MTSLLTALVATLGGVARFVRSPRAVLLEPASRRVHFAGCTAHPDAEWVTQQARQVTWTLRTRPQPIPFLIRDRNRKFSDSFDAVFEAEGARFIQTPIQAPQANGIADGSFEPFDPSV